MKSEMPNIICYLKKMVATESGLWHLPVIPVLKRIKQENMKFRASMCYKVKSLIRL